MNYKIWKKSMVTYLIVVHDCSFVAACVATAVFSASSGPGGKVMRHVERMSKLVSKGL